jgi:hypothetical protein
MKSTKEQIECNQATEYTIRIARPLNRLWTGSLPEMEFSPVKLPDGTVETRTIISVPDQAALRGIRCRLWDLGLTLARLERRKTNTGERSSRHDF